MARILVVDDELMIRDLLAHVLMGAGHEVRTAENGLAAQKLCRILGFDLLITDIIMPEMDGMELIQEMQQHYPQMKILAISGGEMFSPGLPGNGRSPWGFLDHYQAFCQRGSSRRGRGSALFLSSTHRWPQTGSPHYSRIFSRSMVAWVMGLGMTVSTDGLPDISRSLPGSSKLVMTMTFGSFLRKPF